MTAPSVPAGDVAKLVEELRQRAVSYRLGLPSSEHTALLLDQAAGALTAQAAEFAEAAYDDACKRDVGIHQHALALNVERFRAEQARSESLSRDLAKKEAELELLRDHGGDAVELAGRILENLGIGQDASREIGSDRRRERIAAMIERYLSRDLADARARVAELKGEEHLHNAHRRIAEAKLIALSEGAALDGMVLMPVEPDDEMLAATCDEKGRPRLLEFTAPEERSEPFLMPRYIYRAMVSHRRARSVLSTQPKETPDVA